MSCLLSVTSVNFSKREAVTFHIQLFLLFIYITSSFSIQQPLKTVSSSTVQTNFQNHLLSGKHRRATRPRCRKTGKVSVKDKLVEIHLGVFATDIAAFQGVSTHLSVRDLVSNISFYKLTYKYEGRFKKTLSL